MGEFGFFDLEERCEQLHKLGNPLERLHEAIDWMKFPRFFAKCERKSANTTVGGVPGTKC